MKKYFKLLLPIFLISLITLLLFLVGCAPSVPTTPPVSTKATIEGRIMVPGPSTKDISGWVPLPNAVVTLTDSEGKVHTVTTDSEGYYTLFDIPPGINYIITATGKVGENTVILKDIIPKVETGKNYDAGTADSESTALSLVVEALLAEGLTPEEIDLEEIQNTDNFSELVSQVASALEENDDVTSDPVINSLVEEIVEEIVSPETPEPEPSLGGGGGGGAPPAVNHAPTIISTPITTATVEEEYTYDVDANDPDGDTLCYSLVVSPTGMNINEDTGLISWTPSETHVGDNAVVVEVSDSELSTTQGFTITISGSLCGTVISDAGGPAVEGSTVTVVGTTLSTITDAQGRFGIADLADGTYDIIVTKSGRATSKAQDVYIISGQTTVVNLVQKEVNVPAWETDPPTISTTGIAEGAILSGTVNCSVQVDDASDIKYVYVDLYIPNELENEYYNIILPNFNTTLFPDGDYQVTVVAYDMNYNRSQLTLNVNIDNSVAGGTPPGVPTSLWPLSLTFGKKIGFFVEERNKLFERLGIKEDPNIITLRGDKKIDLNAVINTAGPDSTLYVDLDWEPVEGALGYRIYRRFEGEDTFKLIGNTNWPWFYDADPNLSIDRKTYYKVSAYNAVGEGDLSLEEWTTPLPKFNLNLVSPEDGATGISLAPTLQWQPIEVVGKYQEYYFYVMGKNDSYYTWCGGVGNETFVVYNGEPLQYLKVYEWNVDYAIAYDDYYETFPEYRAVSIAGDGNGSLNGAFEFTTQSESE